MGWECGGRGRVWGWVRGGGAGKHSHGRGDPGLGDIREKNPSGK